jgi:alpha-glucosidase
MLARFRIAVVAFATLGALQGCLGKTQQQQPAASAVKAAKPTAAAQLLKTKVSPTAVELETSDGFVRVTMPLPDVFRVRVARQRGARGLASLAVVPELAAKEQPLSVEESTSMLLLRSGQALLRIDKDPLRVRLLDQSGNSLVDDAARVRWSSAGLELEASLAPGEHVFGLGDKAKGFDRRGQSFELWNTDAFGWKVDADPLYKSIPFLLSAQPGRAHGLFIDHPARAHLDVGASSADRLRYSTPIAEAVDLYWFGNGEPKAIIERYAELTGRTPLPPLWALGHHQSRYGYLSEADVRAVVTRMQAENVPLDAVWLDIDFQQDNAPFTVSAKAFPGFARMVSDFTTRGVKTIVITDLHVKSFQRPAAATTAKATLTAADYLPYASGAAGDHFIRDAAGFFEGPVWPGASVFPEFTRERTRKWWGSLYQGFVAQGVAGFWNDMNEPALFVKDKTFPESVQHRLDDGTTAPHSLIHNAYGSLNARATYEGLLELKPEQRPFVLTRAAYAGVQRYAASWTGDNTADRSHLAVTIPQLLNLGVSGYPFNGADVGGFVGCPDAELFAEWMELGALQPFFRNHSMKDACRREPWLFGAATLTRARKAVERRYRLMPYLYTLFEESSRTGAPVMRPLWLEYPSEVSLYEEARAFLLGSDLLVAPKLVAGTTSYSVTLPAGTWYDTLTSERVSGGARQLTSPPADSLRLFARAGAIIPQQAVVASTRDVPRGPLLLEVWPGDACSGSLYVDDGTSFDYRQGKSLRVNYACERSATAFVVTASGQGSYPPWWKQVQLLLHDVSQAPRAVTDATGKALPSQFDVKKRTLAITLPTAARDFRVNASF